MASIPPCAAPRPAQRWARSTSAIGLFVVFASITRASPVRAASDATRVAVLVPQLKPPGAQELRDRFHEALTRGLSAQELQAVPAAEVRLRLGATEEMLACAGAAACVARVSTALRTDWVVAAEIGISGKDFVFKLRLLDAVGRELAHADEACDICTVKEADEAAGRVVAKMVASVRSAPKEPAAPRAVPKEPTPQGPPPAAPVDRTPPPRAAPPEPLGQPAPPVHPPERRTFPWMGTAIGSLALGLVGLAAGIPLAVIDGRPTCDAPDPRRSCPELYDTGAGGGILIALGVAGVAASGALFYLDYRAKHRRDRPHVQVAPLPGGALLTAGGRF